MFKAALFPTAKYWRNLSIHGQMDGEEDVVYMYNRILLSYKKWNFAICNNMDGLRGNYAKQNKSEKDKYCISLIHGIKKTSD